MPDVISTRCPRCAPVRRVGCAQALDRRRDAAAERCGQPEVDADRDDREGDPPVHREAGRAGGPGGLLRGGAGRVRAAGGCWRAWGWRATWSRPSLIPVRAGDRVKTDRRDAKKLVGLYRAGCWVRAAADAGDRGAPRTCCAAAMTSAARGPPRGTGSQAAVAPRARVSRGQESWTISAPGVGAPPAAARSARAGRAGADADPPGRDRPTARHARRPAGADRRPRTWGWQVAKLTLVPRDRDPDRARADRRDRRLRPVRAPARARVLAGDHPQRVLQRRASSTADTSPRPATATPAGC